VETDSELIKTKILKGGSTEEEDRMQRGCFVFEMVLASVVA